jgi:hypothetical protein
VENCVTTLNVPGSVTTLPPPSKAVYECITSKIAPLSSQSYTISTNVIGKLYGFRDVTIN